MSVLATSPRRDERAGKGPAARRRPSWRVGHHDTLWAALFLLPAVALIVTLRVLPAVGAIRKSLYRGFPGGLRPERFTGLDNYTSLFGNPGFRATLVRTVVFNAVINPLQIVLALLLAVLLTQTLSLRGAWRTLIFIPCTIPIVGSSIAWGAALRPDGPVNALLAAVGLRPQPFLTSPNQALACIILIASWIGIGYWMLFLIAGLQAVPHELYEAARLDRAGPIRTFLSVTLPMLRRPLLFVLVADTVANFVLFVPVQLLTNGGPQSSTNLLMFDAYRTTFGFSASNLGAAEVVVLSAVMLAIVAVQFHLLGEDGDGA
jgi:multiple sugar transport system permease protein